MLKLNGVVKSTWQYSNQRLNPYSSSIHGDYMDDYKEIKNELLKEFKILEVDRSDEDESVEVQESGNDCIVLTD